MKTVVLNFTNSDLTANNRSIEYKNGDDIEYLQDYATNFIHSEIAWVKDEACFDFKLDGYINFNDDENEKHVASIVL